MPDANMPQPDPLPNAEGHLGDRLGYNIPANEQFMPNQPPQDDWRPEFDSLGKPQPVKTLPAMPSPTPSNEGQGGASSQSARRQQKTYRRYHGRGRNRWHRKGYHKTFSLWWLIIPLLLISRGHMMGGIGDISWPWIVFLVLCFPGLGVIRGMRRHNPKVLGLLLIVGGIVALFGMTGLPMAIIAPLAIIGLGIYALAKSTGGLAPG